MGVGVSNHLLFPAGGGFAVTPSDSADLSRATRGLMVGVAGAVKVTFFDGTTVTFGTLVAGVIHPLRVKRVFATGTTATGIIGVY